MDATGEADVDMLRDPVIAAVVTVIGNFLLKIFSDWWDRRQGRAGPARPHSTRQPRKDRATGRPEDGAEGRDAPWL